jgi:hypothetical protein
LTGSISHAGRKRVVSAERIAHVPHLEGEALNAPGYVLFGGFGPFAGLFDLADYGPFQLFGSFM